MSPVSQEFRDFYFKLLLEAEVDFDVLVVGGSWAGLSAALQLARTKKRVLLIDAGEPRNRTALYVHGYLGAEFRPPMTVMADLTTEVRKYKPLNYQNTRATEAGRAEDGRFEVKTSTGPTLYARRLILATGVVDELPDSPGLPERWGVQVFSCPYCHGYALTGGRIGILATCEESVQQAILLRDWSRVIRVFTNETFELTAQQRAELEARDIKIETRRVRRLEGQTRSNVGVIVQGRGDAHWLDALFIVPRTNLGTPLASQLGCAIDQGPHGPIVRTDANKETTVKGVYCAGDAARTPPHYASFATADGMVAAMAAHTSLALEINEFDQLLL
jgi:thioredoxin reductase